VYDHPSAAPSPAPSPLPRRILLADADAFFVAVARLVDPEGAGRAKLLIVGGAPGSRGVVCSASYETRAYGVRSAMPIGQALRLCPEATCVPVPRAACAERSRAVRRVLERFAPVVAAASIDEFYLDLTGTERLYGGASLAEVAGRIRAAVLAETELSVSIGGGTSRLIAKMAAAPAKPSGGGSAAGVYVVEPGAEAEFMAGFALGDIPGVGPRASERLRARGLTTVRDALAADRASLERWFGVREAVWLWERVRGVDDSPVVAREAAKSLSREDTFGVDLAGDEELERELLRLSTRVAADLRREALRARTVTVKLRDADFTTRQASRTVDVPVESDRAVHAIARELLARLRRARRTPARLLGVSLSSLRGADEAPQLSLFAADPADGLETARDRALARAVDGVRERFGAGAIYPAKLKKRP
jgi:DNA polymerase IV